MGFIRDIFENIKKKEMIQFIDDFNTMDEESFKLKYENLLNNNQFIIDFLKNNDWKILNLFENERKETLVKSFLKEISSIESKKIKVEAIKHFTDSIFKDEIINNKQLLYNFLVENKFENVFLLKEIDASNDFIREFCLNNIWTIKYTSKEFLSDNKDLIIKYLDDDNHLTYPYVSWCDDNKYKLMENFHEILKEDKEFCLKLIDKGYLEYYEKMGDLKKDPELICSAINKFQEFDASLDYDIKRIAQYPSMLADIFHDINFDKQRLFLSEKVELNGYMNNENDNNCNNDNDCNMELL